ncbi:MAG: RNA polymerase sigma factor [Gemmataceae bacterium]|nr:RNA polymerase sigma factor [Gemmataceae bacterium]
MITSPLNRVVARCRRGALAQAGGPTDGDLLESFIAVRDEAAFEGLVRRHGPMVMGVCQRVIGKVQEAEDAFQATFLVLVRKAASVVPRQAVGNWLYGVAHRTALEARAKINRRQAKEKQVTDMPHPTVQHEAAQHEAIWHELQPLLDQELSRIPDRYRLPLVLCELEGRSRKEVARQLDVPEGTLSSRLATARKMLAGRLARRGLAVPAATLAVVLGQHASAAAVPAPLVVSTVQAAALVAAGKTAAGLISIEAAALTEGVVKVMLLSKLKATAAFLIVAGALAFGSGTVAYRSLAADRPAATVALAAAPFADEDFMEQDTAQQEVAQRPQVQDGAAVAGKLEAVDADKGSVTISTFKRGEGRSEKTYVVAKDAKIVRDGKEAKLTDLKRGSQTTLRLAADQKTVVGIRAGTPPMTGPLKAVDAANNTIIVTVSGRPQRQEKTFQVAKDAKITIDGKDAKLSDLKPGATIILVATDGNTITEIRTGARRDRKRDE